MPDHWPMRKGARSTRSAPSIQRHQISNADCQKIARSYDGTTACIDRLLAEWSARLPGIKRHTIMRAAVRGGYQSSRDRRNWTESEDRYLRNNWHLRSGDEIAQVLNRSFTTVNLRRKRLGIGRYEGDEFTVRDLEELTAIDHRQWHDFIGRGWLRARSRGRRRGAAPITYVSIPALASLLATHPEILDVRKVPGRSRVALELDKLPKPPHYKRVICRSTSWGCRVRPMPRGRRVTHGPAELEMRRQSFENRSCAEEGGTAFWAPIFDLPVCPRCGCQVSRFSEDALFTDLDPGDDEVIDIQARKIGLSWSDGQLRNEAGAEIRDREVLDYLFSAGRRSARSVRAFAKLIEAGVEVMNSTPVKAGVLLGNILDFELRADQEQALQTFAKTGSMTAVHAMSFGKSTLGLMVLTRIAGRHLLMVDTRLLREQWIESLRAHAPTVEVRHHAKPSRTVVRVLDRGGAERCVIDIYSYQSRARLEGPWVVGCFDEVHRLPAAMAHRHSFAKTQYRIGLSATAEMRADGRGALIGKMTGTVVGDDWTEQMDSGIVPRIPVKVLLVEDREHKHEVVGTLLAKHQHVVVLCEALADGRELERRYGIPFVCSETKEKLRIIRSSRSVVLSRIGDAGISMPECEVTVDHSGLFGSRIQSLQRLGRLMHSHQPRYHCILMTPAERYERFAARIDAIKAKGFEVEEAIAPRARPDTCTLLPPALRQRVAARDNPFLSLLGWRRDDLMAAVRSVASSP